MGASVWQNLHWKKSGLNIKSRGSKNTAFHLISLGGLLWSVIFLVDAIVVGDIMLNGGKGLINLLVLF